MAKLSTRQIQQQLLDARERDTAERAAGLRAVTVRYDRTTARIVLELTNGYQVGVPLSAFPQLGDAPRSAIAAVSLSPGGESLMFEASDIHYSVSALVLALSARENGRRGGRARSAAKRRAARLNGAKGGRPRKLASS
ncbi:MAG: DUF2442 domain-containing protein [Gemmatimonadaceae bacterium]|nr:DUF2442 domain-containing protein [Gemmatimonadaceae bacterium]